MRFPDLTNQKLFERRNAYAYPAFALFGQRPELKEIEFLNSFELDNYLSTLLNSNDHDQVVTGYLAVVFWGHASGADGRDLRPRAHSKVHQALQKNMPDETIFMHVTSAVESIRTRRFSLALQSLCNLPQLQMAFASKVCAFIAPDSCGVIDSVIAENHPCLEFDCRRGFVTNTSANRTRYEQYCLLLQERMKELNSDPDFGNWTDRDGLKHYWRAIDVERALFA